MKRLFIAIKIIPDQDFLDQFRQLKTALSNEKIKWVEEHNIHVTLKFLGNTETNKIAEIERVMTSIRLSAFSFRLKHLGIFGSKYDPRVVWTGIEPYAELVLLMKTVHDALRNIGFEPDRQNMVPHLTLGRVKEISDKHRFQKIIDRFGGIESVEMPVSRFILYESILKKEGPVYIPLKVFELKASQG